MSTTSPPPQAQFPQAQRYVGRQSVIASLGSALRRAEQERRCLGVYIESEGGLGKSFLLKKLPELLAGQIGQQRLAAARIIDLSDSDTRRGLVVEEMLISGLRRNEGQWYRLDDQELNRAFSDYQRARDLYEQERARLSPAELPRRRKALQDLFVRGLNRLAERRPLVLRFDTTETLTRGQIANQFLRDEFPSSTGLFLDWIFAVMPQLRGVLVVFSGRPPLPNSDEPAIDSLLTREELLAAPKQSLTPLDKSEIRDYMLAYGQPAPSEAEVDRIWDQTGGHPLLITSLIERRASSPRAPQSEIRTTEAFKEDLLDEVLNPIAHRVDHERRIFSYCLYVLSFARRGITRDQLATCLRALGYNEIPGSETAISDRVLNQILDQLSSSALVKLRPPENLLYLHDEIFAMIDGSDRADALGMRDEVLTFLIGMTRRQLAEAEAQATSSAPGDPRRSQNRSARFVAQSNLVYYTLALNVDDGYRLYLQVMSRLFNRREALLALTLRDELMRWLSLELNLRRLDESKLQLSEVASDDAVWLVKYNLHTGQNQKAVEIGQRIREELAAEIERDHYFKFDLYVTLGNALTILRDAEQGLALQLFDEVLALFDRPRLNQKYMHERRGYFAGVAHLYAGYLHRTLADYERASAHYVTARQQFERYLEDPEQQHDFDTTELFSQVTLNLAFIDAQQGNLMRARALLRRLRDPALFGQLSADRQAAVCNVESIVYLFSGNLQLASQSVAEAWRIATNLDDRRIRGQVAHQFANVLHEQMKLSGERDVEAETYFRDAEEIFRQEATALRETLIDHGKYARNLALSYRNSGDQVNAERYFDQANQRFEQALAATGTDEPTLQRAEILECLAVIARLADQLERADELLTRAEADLAARPMPAYAQIIAGTVAFERAQLALAGERWSEALRGLVVALARAYYFSPEYRTVKAFQTLSEQHLGALPPPALDQVRGALADLKATDPPIPAASLEHQLPADPKAWDLAVRRSIAFFEEMLGALVDVGGRI